MGRIIAFEPPNEKQPYRSVSQPHVESIPYVQKLSRDSHLGPTEEVGELAENDDPTGFVAVAWPSVCATASAKECLACSWWSGGSREGTLSIGQCRS